MKITYATAHTWHKNILPITLDQFGKNDKARLTSTLKKAQEGNIEIKIQKLDEAFLDWFIPMYVQRISEKANPVVFDIHTKTLGNKRRAHRFYSMTLYEHGKAIGGTVFILRKTKISIAYRTYAYKWTESTLQASPSLYAEYAITEFARAQDKKTIIHGKDRNPYGKHSNIGLAIFKLSVGCQPKKSRQFEIQEIDTDTLDSDTLIFEYPGNLQQDITKAYLVVSKENLSKWEQVTKYPERLSVEVLLRN